MVLREQKTTYSKSTGICSINQSWIRMEAFGQCSGASWAWCIHSTCAWRTQQWNMHMNATRNPLDSFQVLFLTKFLSLHIQKLFTASKVFMVPHSVIWSHRGWPPELRSWALDSQSLRLAQLGTQLELIRTQNELSYFSRTPIAFSHSVPVTIFLWCFHKKESLIVRKYPMHGRTCSTQKYQYKPPIIRTAKEKPCGFPVSFSK